MRVLPGLLLSTALVTGPLVATGEPAHARAGSSCRDGFTLVREAPLVAPSGRTVGRARLLVSPDGRTYCGDVRVVPRYHRTGTKLHGDIGARSEDFNQTTTWAEPLSGPPGQVPALTLGGEEDLGDDEFAPGTRVQYRIVLLRWSRTIADVVLRTRVPAA